MAQAAALETVHRLERALSELEVELDYRRTALGQIVADRHERGARLFKANQAGARFVFGGASGSPNTAERAGDDADPSAVQVLAQHIAEAPRLDAEETAALSAVDALERRVLQTRRALAHWRSVAGNPDSGPVACAPTEPPTAPEAETAKAATTQRTDHEPSAAQSPALGSASIRDRLAGLAERVAGG